MATVTGGGSTTVVNVGSNDANGVAQALANVISAGLAAGTLTRVASPQNNPPTGTGAATISTTGGALITNAPAVSVDLIAAGGSVVGGGSQNIVGSGLPNQQVLGDNENITYFTNGGGGSFVFGDGNDIFGTPTVGGGVSNVQTGAGNDTINIYSGLATVAAGPGNNVINTGMAGTTSNVLVFASGNDRIISTGGAGTDTVIAGNGSTFILEATKNLVFNGQGGNGSVTIVGGRGSDTVFAGPGGGSIGGGSAGNNALFGGTGTAGTTLFGGGSGDLLFARGSGQTVLVAGSGNETLTGAGSTGNNVFIAGQGGNTTIGGGVGNDSIFIGNPGSTSSFGGNVVADGGLGNDLFSFTNRGAGGSSASVLINNFRSGSSANDQIQLVGYGADQRANITNAAAGAGTVTLSDGTRITFGTAVNLNNTNFA